MAKKNLNLVLIFLALMIFSQTPLEPPPESVSLISQGLVGRWNFNPVYTLPGKARNLPGIKQEPEPIPPIILAPAKSFPRLFGNEPTEVRTGLVKESVLPRKEMSIELWVLDHLDQPVGIMASAMGSINPFNAGWFLAYYDHKVYFGLKSAQSKKPEQAMTIISELKPKPWKKWFYHLVGVYDGKKTYLYVNGELVASSQAESGELLYDAAAEFALIGYFVKEPYLQLGNLVKEIWLYSRALSAEEISSRLWDYQKRAEEGIFLTVEPHFTMGPILQNVSSNRITIVWETDRPTTGLVKYDESASLKKQLEVSENQRLHRATLSGLKPGTQYFYNVLARTEDGAELESGILTFKTAVLSDSAFSFVVLGDTETRPFINDRLAKLIWGHRPDFGILLGDLTDEGNKDNKFQWSYEFFPGMGQILSRIPFFPVVGNSEQDLYWFNYFFEVPGFKSYYKFSYGNADFFILNSNLPHLPFAPGTPQYLWLEKELASSTALWKIVCLHYAPYSSDENDYGNSYEREPDWGDKMVRGYIPLYEKYGVDIVFYGHLHCYERSWPLREGKVVEKNGVLYILSGGGGGNLEDFAPSRPWFSNVLYRGHHFCLVNINQNNLQFRMYDLEGRIQDFFQLTK